jgi:outer membrane murein-binding lipoprotein Lpp
MKFFQASLDKKFILKNANMNKKMYTLLVVVVMIFLSGCAIENKKTEQKPVQVDDLPKKQQEIFDKNQECFKLKEKIEQKLENKQSPFGKTSLEQIFYSPKQNSCLYVEYSEFKYANSENCYNRRLLDVLNDGESSQPLEGCLSVCPSLKLDSTTGGIQNNCINFDRVLEEYKK